MQDESPPVWLGAACAFLEDHAAGPVTIADLASATDIDPDRLMRGFDRYLGFTPTEFHDALRSV